MLQASHISRLLVYQGLVLQRAEGLVPRYVTCGTLFNVFSTKAGQADLYAHANTKQSYIGRHRLSNWPLKCA